MGKKIQRILWLWTHSSMMTELILLIRLLTCSEAREHVQTYSSSKGFSFWDEICKGTRYYIKFETLNKCHDIVSISSHCKPINFESLYQFRVIVSISNYCINFESLYQFRVIVSISSHCINFKSLYHSILSNPNCINAMTWHVFVSLYQFRVIVGLSILRHSINLETFY